MKVLKVPNSFKGAFSNKFEVVDMVTTIRPTEFDLHKKYSNLIVEETVCPNCNWVAQDAKQAEFIREGFCARCEDFKVEIQAQKMGGIL